MITWCARLLAARLRVPSSRSRFPRYLRYNTWHICDYTQYLPFDSGEWIEVSW